MKELLKMKILSLCKSEINLVFTGLSCFLSIASLFVAYESAKSSNEIALQALATATQANEISLGRLREPSAFQFADGGTKEIDLRTTAALEQELRLYVTLQNDGKKIIDGAVFEAIGMEGLTYVEDEPNLVVRELPSIWACPRFCVNGLMAGNCRSSQRKRNDRKQRIDRPPVGGLQKA